MVVIPFYVSPAADHVRAKPIVHDAVLSSRFVYLGKPIWVLVSMRLADDLGAIVELTAKAYVYAARHEKDFASDVADRVSRVFRDNDVAFPGMAAQPVGRLVPLASWRRG
jgi:hypothetical protein